MAVTTKRKPGGERVNGESRSDIRERQKRLTERRKEAIFALCGGKICVGCSETDPELLQFDHKTGRDWDVRKFSSTTRLKNYLFEAIEGRIQILCISCNSSKGRPDDEPDDTPF